MDSPAAEIAARAMSSSVAQFFHDHVLVKEPGTPMPTPWHQDVPYYLVEGEMTCSIWIPLEPVSAGATGNTLRFIAGSHKWPHMVKPVSWSDNSDFYDEMNSSNELVPEEQQQWAPVPAPDEEEAASSQHKVLEWALEPGDCVLFSFRSAHGARGNLQPSRRRALSLRWVGDDARYVERPGKTSPPFPGHGMQAGQRLREDWFPVVWPLSHVT
jgi:ectoine hydroxylase-related dioxygenase (phytanoyl-CoA dioxygenase family)